MADMADTLKSLLGDDAEDKIKNVMSSLGADGGSSLPAATGGADLGQLMQLRSMMESMMMNRNDPRTNLLMSLKPYMRSGRQQSIDSAVKLMGVANIARLLGK